MGVIFCDGMDLNFADNTKGLWDTLTKGTNPNLYWGSATARNGAALRLNSGQNDTAYLVKNVTVAQTMYGGAAVRFSAVPVPFFQSSYVLFQWADGVVVHLSLCVDSSGNWQVRRGEQGGTVLATGSAVAANTWYYLEWKVTISNTVGEFYLKINGSEEFNLTAVDTNNGALDQITKVRIVSTQVNPAHDSFWDDVVLRDDQLPGQPGVYLLTPNADGTYEQWSLSAGVDTYALLDEDPPDMADYIYDQTSGDKSTVNTSHSIPTGVDISALMVFALANLSIVGTNQFKLMVRSGTTDSAGSAQTPGITEQFFKEIWTTDPASGAPWAEAGIDAVEIGVEVV